MIDLPTRERVQEYITKWRPNDKIFQAYADGVLMTREEWLDNLSIEAALEWLRGLQLTKVETAKVLGAALGKDTEMITWREAATAFPEFVQWIVQRKGGLPDGEIIETEWDSLREEYQTALGEDTK